MSRSKKLVSLLAVLLVVCLVTLGISHIEVKKEKIRTGGQALLEIPVDTVTKLSWESKDGPKPLAFHKGEQWVYDEDAAFPADPEKIEALLKQFEDFRAAFVIDEVEDESLYGLDDPEATIRLTAGEQDYEIRLGDFSKMDQQRYVSLGDGKAYLVDHDPMDEFDAVLGDLILDDAVPALSKATAIRFSGEENYELSKKEDGPSYRKKDNWFTQTEEGEKPLDPAKVNSYLSALSGLELDAYKTYNATQEELSACGMDQPELTVSVDYPPEEGKEAQPFVLHISRDPKEKEAAEAKAEKETSENSSAEEETEEKITAYARVGESPIVYELSAESYKTLKKAAFNDLRHENILPADFESVSALEVELGGETHSFTSKGSGEDRKWYYGDAEMDIAEIQRTLAGLKASEFAQDAPTGKLELSVTAALDLEGEPRGKIELYRKDGTSCTAVVDGTPIASVERSQVVELMEAVNAIILNEQTL